MRLQNHAHHLISMSPFSAVVTCSLFSSHQSSLLDVKGRTWAGTSFFGCLLIMKPAGRSHFSFADSAKTPVAAVSSATQQKACLFSSEQTILHMIPSSILQEL